MVSPHPLRVLLFAYYFPPQGGAGSQRLLSFARHLPDHDCDVTVVTPEDGMYGRDPSLLEGLDGRARIVRTDSWEPRVLLDRLRGRRAVSATTVDDASSAAGSGSGRIDEARLGVIGSALRHVVRRALYFPDSARGWIRPATAAALREHAARPFDVALSSSPPLSAHLAATRFARRTGVPLVLDFRDLPRGAIADPAGREGALTRRLLAGCRRAVTVSPTSAEWLRGVDTRVTPDLVYNGWEAAAPSATAVVQSGDPYVAYAGTVYDTHQDLRPLLAAVADVRRDVPGFHLRLAGRVYDVAREQLRPHEQSGALVYEGFVPRTDVTRLLRGAAAIVVSAWEGDGPIGRSQIPAKLYEALPLGRPVISVVSPDSDAEVVSRSAGLQPVHHGDQSGLLTALHAVATGEVHAHVNGGLIPESAAIAPFSRAQQAERLAVVLRQVGGGSPSSG